LVFVQINLFALALNGFTGTRTGDTAYYACCTGRIRCAVIGLSCLTRCHRQIGFVDHAGELSVFLVFFEPEKIRSPVTLAESFRVSRLSVDSAFGISDSCKVK